MPDHIDEIITEVIENEVGGKPDGGYTNDPTDRGGRTQYGIAEASNPKAWADGKVTEDEARAIYRHKYVEVPGFDRITDLKLQSALIDWGVISGPMVATQYLQRILGVNVDGTLGPKTMDAANGRDPRELTLLLVAERVRMIGRIVKKNPSQLKYINGWLDRALEFLA